MIVEDIFRIMNNNDNVVIDTLADLANYDSGKSIIYEGESVNIPVKLFKLPVNTIYAIDNTIHIIIEESNKWNTHVLDLLTQVLELI